MYHRIVLKLSGETLSPLPGGTSASPCFESARVDAVADTVIALRNMGVQPAIVLGGGNIWRGRFSDAMDPAAADQMGMLATVINALALSEAINRKGERATVYSAQEMTRFCELYRADRADGSLDRGEIVLLSGGTGNPFFTTDTGAVLRAAELRADAVFKGTTVDGVYDSDPHKNPAARLIPSISYAEAVEKGLHVMDITAFQLCLERQVPCIRIFSMDQLENILRVARGESIGSTVHL